MSLSERQRRRMADDDHTVPNGSRSIPTSSSATGASEGASDDSTVAAAGNVSITKEDLAKMMVSSSASSKPEESPKHAFWSTQPVPQLGDTDVKDLEQLSEVGEAIETKTVTDVPKSPLALISMFEWSEVDITDDAHLEEVYQLLNLHYVEDGEQMFRFDYSRDFLRWALMPPGWLQSWHVGVRVKDSGKLVAFITAIPATVAVRNSPIVMVEINFLCVHKKLRAKRLAPVLIQEITRRVNLQNIWQAAYTAGALLPSPVSSSRYFHRSLNPKKLIEVGFSRIGPRMTLARTIKLNVLKSEPEIPGIRPLTDADVPEACKLMEEHNKRFELRVEYSEADFAHWFLPRDGVVHSYVVENPKSGKITDMFSFYSLPSSIIRHPKHKTLYAAYSFCTIAMTKEPAKLMQDALILARGLGFDVFNALDLARNDEFLESCKFHVGDGDLRFYMYNWKCRPIDRRKNALVLL